MTDARPLCPRCGCPARSAVGLVEADITFDITGAPVGPTRVLPGATVDSIRHYRCGGNHKWAAGESVVRPQG